MCRRRFRCQEHAAARPRPRHRRRARAPRLMCTLGAHGSVVLTPCPGGAGWRRRCACRPPRRLRRVRASSSAAAAAAAAAALRARALRACECACAGHRSRRRRRRCQRAVRACTCVRACASAALMLLPLRAYARAHAHACAPLPCNACALLLSRARCVCACDVMGARVPQCAGAVNSNALLAFYAPPLVARRWVRAGQRCAPRTRRSCASAWRRRNGAVCVRTGHRSCTARLVSPQ